MAWRIKEGEDPGYTLYDVADRLRARGWQVPAYPLTGSVSDISVQRILVRQGVSRDLAGLLLEDMKESIAHFDRHPVTVSDDQGGVRRLQPPVAASAGRGTRRHVATSRRAGGGGAGSAVADAAGRSVVHGAGRPW